MLRTAAQIDTLKTLPRFMQRDSLHFQQQARKEKMELLLLKIIMVLLGFVFLVGGADLLVRGGAGIARYYKISPLVVGLTIVAYGTSMPEFMASMIAIIKDIPSLAMGNILGSNIFNICMVLGISAIIKPIEIEREIFNRQLPVLSGVLLLVVLLGWTGNRISHIEGVLLFLGIIYYTFQSFRDVKSQIEPPDLEPDDIWAHNRLLSGAAVLLGSVFLFLGGQWVVDGSIFIAHQANIPPRIIGGTVIAIGTSLPELITSVVSIIRKETQIGVGNAIGSCIFNLLMVVGGSAAIRPISILWHDFSVELVFTFISVLILWPLTYSHRLLKRGHGYILVALYAIFTLSLLLLR